MALGSMLDILHQKPFIRVSVKDFIWGYESPLVRLGNDILPAEEKLPFNKFGIFTGVRYPSGIVHIQGVPSACGLGWVYLNFEFYTVPNSAWADGNLAEAKMVEHPNQPNQGPRAYETPCKKIV